MKKIVFSLVLFLSAISVFSQDFEPIFTIGLNGGIDHNINAYQIPPNTVYHYAYYGIPDQYNVGLDFAVAATKRIRPRLELRYVNLQYGVKWNVPPGVSTYDMIRSTHNINNFDITFHFDYLLASVKKLDIYASPGIKYEFNTGDYLHTTLTDGPSTSNNYNILGQSYPRSLGAGVFSFLFKYNLSKHFGITVTPEYNLFWRDFVSDNGPYQFYQRLSLNAGLEFRL